MKSDLGRGSLVLARGDREVLLVWSKGEEGEARPLPPGEYRLRTTRVEREREGAHWFVSLSGPPGGPIRVAEGRTTTIPVGDAVRFAGHAKGHGGELRLGFSLKGADGRGLSIYREDRRQPVTYRVLDAEGGVLAEGRMNYG